MAQVPTWDALVAELQNQTLAERIATLEHYITLLDRQLEKTPTDEGIAYLEHLADLHHALVQRAAFLHHPDALLVVEFPADYTGPVGVRWEELPDGRIRTWLTRDELEAIVWANEAAYTALLNRLAA
ncbi:hypothetical protein ARMA_0825 [Ardenticatena maritima]|uniref:DUF2203 family protein n=1 Tax=Ardenticatena maritima TaxID=872965 RepID=A0A0M8K7N0_9CHLR|nr:hypothetical protein [Ardenticatena maritima]KPL89493.1 hypothetical protein SE16_03420 [Ardenticatena maritima]GAP62402.1 hypothetical protein ARMA_0825 [Ardenticatena maritima]